MFDERPEVCEGEALDLVRAATKLVTDGVGEADAGDLGERLVALERARRMLTAAVAEVIATVERTDAFRDDGHLSVRTWVLATVNTSRADAFHDVRVARLTAAHPDIGSELAAGRLGVAQVRALAATAANPRVTDAFAAVVEPMLDCAVSDPYDEFTATLRDWERLADADGAHHDHERAHAGRRARFAIVGDTAYLDANFAAVHGTELQEILEHFTDAEFHADWDDARARHGDAACPGLLARTDAQRRADALRAIFLRAASTPPGGNPPEPVVDIVTTQAVLEEQLAAMLDGRTPDFGHLDPLSNWCRTTTGDPVDPTVAVAAALVGHVRRVVVGSGRVVTDFGRRTRLFARTARQAFAVQAALQTGGRCLWPGCGRRHTQIDHTHEWASGGSTDLANAGPLCRHHNIWKTHGYHCWRDPDGHWHTHRPDGTEIHPA